MPARCVPSFCNWLEVQGYVQVATSSHVKMPKVGRSLIRIIEFEEFERLLKACASPHEVGPTTNCNATRVNSDIKFLKSADDPPGKDQASGRRT